jgi:hypothetical protein
MSHVHTDTVLPTLSHYAVLAQVCTVAGASGHMLPGRGSGEIAHVCCRTYRATGLSLLAVAAMLTRGSVMLPLSSPTI